jgi:hypothetical protein
MSCERDSLRFPFVAVPLWQMYGAFMELQSIEDGASEVSETERHREERMGEESEKVADRLLIFLFRNQ